MVRFGAATIVHAACTVGMLLWLVGGGVGIVDQVEVDFMHLRLVRDAMILLLSPIGSVALYCLGDRAFPFFPVLILLNSAFWVAVGMRTWRWFRSQRAQPPRECLAVIGS